MAALGNANLSQIIQTYEAKKLNDNNIVDIGRHTNEKFIGVLFPRPYEWGGNHGRTR